MTESFKKTLIKTVGLGNLAGIRSMAAPAIVFQHFNKHNSQNLADSKLGFAQSSSAALAASVLSALEVAGDKLPGVPDRIILPQVLGRVASGALVGAVLFQAEKEEWVKGAVIGGISALAATYVSFFARQFFGKIFAVKEPYAGALEDAIAFGGGSALMRA
jgi:uncharacterized membrane protein